MNKIKLTKSEMELMELFWKEDRPLTSVQILELSNDQSWSGQYLHKMLKSLERQGVIAVCGTIQYGNQYARQFHTLLTHEEVAAKTIMSQGFNKENIAKIAVALVKETKKTKEVSNEEIVEELERMLEEYKADDTKK